jgi:hypothetical protein
MTGAIMDLAAFKAQYPEWIARARPALEQKRWKEAFAGFPGPVNAAAPWTIPAKPLADCRLALLSTAGLYVAGEQAAFDAENPEGDWTFRELPAGVDGARLAIAHAHYDHASARQDLNAVFPLDRLREFAAERIIGSLAERVFSTSGYCTRLDLVVEETAPRIVAGLKADGVDAVLHIPV